MHRHKQKKQKQNTVDFHAREIFSNEKKNSRAWEFPKSAKQKQTKKRTVSSLKKVIGSPGDGELNQS